VNKGAYELCAACSEPPLGAGGADDASTEEGGKAKELFAAPKHEDRAYYELLKSVLIVGSTAFCSSMGGLVLQQQQFSVEAEVFLSFSFLSFFTFCVQKLSIWSRYDFWQWCIFSDFCEKSGMSVAQVAKDPYSIPAYPDLFPLAAFYLNAMVSVSKLIAFCSRLLKQKNRFVFRWNWRRRF
jgi:hypothetical protein